jgi:hypothetical protein
MSEVAIGPMSEEQRQRWNQTGLFPIERWGAGPGKTPLVCQIQTNNELRELALAVPSHIQASGWYTEQPRFGRRYLYAENFKGMGRQWIADVHPDARYSSGLAEYLAAVHPRTVLRLLDQISSLEQELARRDGA